MAYFAPHIDAAGLHIPTYVDIRDDLIAEFKRIYGQDIYLDNDSQDYQMISAFALKTYDTMQLLQIVYNNRGPKTAVGSALDGLVKLNGIKRKAASYSSCVLSLTGSVGAVIKGGTVEDDAGIKWSLPDEVILRESPQKVTAICNTLGAIEAVPGSITKIMTPTKGWISVTNEVPAVIGAPVELDETLKKRQSFSVAIPSQNMLDGVIGGIAAVEGVKRYKAYDNDTNVTDVNGIPGHTIAAVVEGGLDAEIAEQIFLRKGPGAGTYGDVSTEYIGSDGEMNTIRFFRPVYAYVDVQVSIRRNAGYVPDFKEQIEHAIRIYLEELDIGNDVTTTGALASVLSLLGNLSRPPFSIAALTLARRGETAGVSDIKMSFKEVATVGTITVMEV